MKNRAHPGPSESRDQLRRRFASRLVTELALGTPLGTLVSGDLELAGARPGSLDLDGIAGRPSTVMLGRGTAAVAAAMDVLLRQVRTSVDWAVTRPAQGRAASSQWGGDAARSVRHRVLADEHCAGEVLAPQYCSPDLWLERRIGAVDVPLVLLDRRAVVVEGPALGACGSGLRATWLVSCPEVLGAATGLFESRWRQGRPYAGEAADGLTERQQRVAALLLRGLGERAIGRELRVSVRTVASEVTALMCHLGAAGRVDLGYRLRRREESLAG